MMMRIARCPLMTRHGLVAVLLAVGGVPGAAAQTRAPLPLDDARLIDGLVERRLDVLLDHLAQTGSFADPSLPRLIEIGQLRAGFLDPGRPAAERRERLLAANAAWRQLLDNPGFAGHPQMPVWRTQYAEQRLVYELEIFNQAAAAFYEFGVPTAAQIAAFEDVVPAALAQLVQAEKDLRDLSDRISRDPALKARLESTLAYYRIFDDYRDQKTRYYAALARYLVSLLPDANSFWQTAPPAGDPSAARTALLRRAAQGLAGFTDGSVSAGDSLRARAQSLAGRVAMAAGDRAAATPHLTAAATAPTWNLDVLGAGIARANLLGNPAGRAQLEGLASSAAVAGHPAAQLLVADARFRLLRDAGEPTAAYDVYFELLDTPGLGDRAAALRQVIYDRWAAALGPDDDLAALPPAVRLGVADIARRRGVAARATGDGPAALTDLRRAVAAARALADDPTADPALVAAGQYQLAYARSLLEPGNLAVVLDACRRCVRVAREHPQLPVATDAITLAAALARTLYGAHPGRPGVAETFDDTATVLFDSGHFDTIPAADNQRVFFTRTRLQNAGRYAEAAASYDRLLPTHPDYAAAQSFRAQALVARLSENPPADAATRRALTDAARAAIARVVAVAPGPRVRDLDAAAARAMLAEADLAVLSNQPDQALAVLDRYEARFAARVDLMLAGLERRVLLLVDAGDLDRARDEAAAMMGRFPRGAAPVINAVLNDLEARINRITREPGVDAATAAPLADTAAGLAKLLADWAGHQGLDDRGLLPYHLVVLKSLRIAGRSGEALAYLEDHGLTAAFPDNVDVLLEHASALAATGRPDELARARPMLNRILTGLSEPYPPAYWAAWVTRLRISLDLDDKVADIPRRVRLLESRHPDLGGEPYASRLRAIAGEAAGRISGIRR